MAGIKQVIEFAHEEIKNILMEKANDMVSETAGKELQGKSTCTFTVGNGDEKSNEILMGAVVTFERAGN